MHGAHTNTNNKWINAQDLLKFALLTIAFALGACATDGRFVGNNWLYSRNKWRETEAEPGNEKNYIIVLHCMGVRVMVMHQWILCTFCYRNRHRCPWCWFIRFKRNWVHHWSKWTNQSTLIESNQPIRMNWLAWNEVEDDGGGRTDLQVVGLGVDKVLNLATDRWSIRRFWLFPQVFPRRFPIQTERKKETQTKKKKKCKPKWLLCHWNAHARKCRFVFN